MIQGISLLIHPEVERVTVLKDEENFYIAKQVYDDMLVNRINSYIDKNYMVHEKILTTDSFGRWLVQIIAEEV